MRWSGWPQDISRERVAQARSGPLLSGMCASGLIPTIAQTRAARALCNSAVANCRETVLSAFQQVDDDLATLRLLQSEYGQEAQAGADVERSETLTLNQYKAGVADYASVLTARTARLCAEITARNVENQRLVASIDLIDATGGGWSSAELERGNEGSRSA